MKIFSFILLLSSLLLSLFSFLLIVFKEHNKFASIEFKWEAQLIYEDKLTTLLISFSNLFSFINIGIDFNCIFSSESILKFENGIKVLLDKFSIISFVLFLYIILFTVWIGIILYGFFDINFFYLINNFKIYLIYYL